MADRWIVVSMPGPELVVVATRPFRTKEAAQKVADSLDRTGEEAGMDWNATAQVVRIESVAEVRQHIRDGSAY